MNQLTFNPPFSRAISICRLAIYLCFGGLGSVHAWLTGYCSAEQLVVIAVVMGGLLATLHLLLLQPCPAWLLVGGHVLECACLMAIASAWQLPLLSHCWLAVIVLAANTALWGWRSLSLFAGVCAAVAAIAHATSTGVPAVASAIPWLDAWAAGAGVVFVLVICAVAHHQAQQLVALSRHLRREKRHLLRYLPRGIAGHLRQPHPPELQREWLTVVFVDLVGFTQASRELPPETLVSVLNDFLTDVSTHVENWGGDVSKFLGDGLLCVFQAPEVEQRPNAAAQSVRCVAQMPALLEELNVRWQKQGQIHRFGVTCGVASGFCCSGDWGGLSRLDYTVIGIPVNLSQRLQQAAAQQQQDACGGVLLDATTWTLVQGDIPTGPERMFNLKGLGEVPGYELRA